MPKNFLKAYVVLLALATACAVIIGSLFGQDFPCRDMRSLINTEPTVSPPIIRGIVFEDLTASDYFCASMGLGRYAYTLYYPEVFILLSCVIMGAALVRLLVQRRSAYKFFWQVERLWLIVGYALVIVSFGSLWSFVLFKIESF